MLQDRAIGCLFLGLCALLWFVVLPMEVPGEEQIIYPRLTVIFMAIPALFMVLRGRRRPGAAHASARAGMPERAVLFRIFLLMLLMALCIALTSVVGFFAANFLCAVGYMLFFGERRLSRVLGVPAILLAAIYVIVVRLLHYPLPEGILF